MPYCQLLDWLKKYSIQPVSKDTLDGVVVVALAKGEPNPFPFATRGLKFLHLPEDSLETFIHPEKIETLRRAFGIEEKPPTTS